MRRGARLATHRALLLDARRAVRAHADVTAGEEYLVGLPWWGVAVVSAWVKMQGGARSGEGAHGGARGCKGWRGASVGVPVMQKE